VLLATAFTCGGGWCLLNPPFVASCGNCAKGAEDIGDPIKVMACGRCKSKLNFAFHYCSRCVFLVELSCVRIGLMSYKKCEVEDWCNHKEYCGVKKVAKPLESTIHDKL
jgi:hypothetical protein